MKEHVTLDFNLQHVAIVKYNELSELKTHHASSTNDQNALTNGLLKLRLSVNSPTL